MWLDFQSIIHQEALRITKREFTTIKNDADTRGTRLLVVPIPTKERAYCRYLKDSGERMPIALVRLCDAEELVKEDRVQFFATRKIAHVYATGAMEKRIQKHIQIYIRRIWMLTRRREVTA